jgi:hypothetical protein
MCVKLDIREGGNIFRVFENRALKIIALVGSKGDRNNRMLKKNSWPVAS